MDNAPPFIEIYSENGEPQSLAKHAIGYYKLSGPFTLNGLPIYKHNCLDLYIYYDKTSRGFCVSYDPYSKNCLLIFDLSNDLEQLVWDTDKQEYVATLQMKYRFLNDEPEVQKIFSYIPKRLKITSEGAFGQMV